MDAKTIRLGNFKIAKYMGYELKIFPNIINAPNPEKEYWDKNKEVAIGRDNLKYDYDWNAIVPVLEFISKEYDIDMSFYDTMFSCRINKQALGCEPIADRGNFEYTIDNVWLMVVDFIDWYNKENGL